mmetsp:Transcript_30564/g.68531  ORF Transcript_30564/g.68531 Transcript_30564/m.68531 type:complete len:534 (+) Transcript_30564:198-1799(+)
MSSFERSKKSSAFVVDSSMIMTFGLLGVLGCALLGAKGFTGRPDTVGIDLGTTFSVIALRTPNGTDVLRDADGRALVPSAVYFGPNGESPLVGHAAQELQHLDPKHFVYNAKRWIGRNFDEPAVAEQAKLHPFDIVRNQTASFSQAWFGSADGRIMTPAHEPKKGPALLLAAEALIQLVEKAFESKTRAYGPGGGGAGVGSSRPEQDLSIARAAVSPETVGSLVLKHLLDIAELNLGHRQVSKAVMAVPAKFNAEQRRATAEAFKQAGLRVMRIIEEPTAAALAYGLDKKKNVEYILVYDFGGGTLDVSLLFVNKESVQVIATHGDDELGGADFDHCLAQSLGARFEEQLGPGFKQRGCALTRAQAASAQATQAEKGGSEETAADRAGGAAYAAEGQSLESEATLACSESNVRVLAERAKRTLSSREVAGAACSAFLEDGGGGECESVEVSVSKAAFESECKALFDRSMLPVDNLLDEALMPKTEIDEVVLVGGSSRIPLIRSKLKDYFGIHHLNAEIDPDLTVAIGAASIVD